MAITTISANLPTNIKDVHIQNYINGEWAPPTMALISQIPDSASADVDNAVKAAKAAFPLWSKTPNSSILGTFESLDQGKPVFSAIHFEMPMCAASFRQFAKLITDGGIKESESRLDSMITPTSITQPKASITESVTQHIAAGVAGLITPWSFPLPMPTELSSITSFLLSHILHAAGVPKGVVNIIFGSGLGAGEPLVKHKDVKLISFTGGSATGARIGALASGQFKRVSLELGGKNPAVFFDDCNIDHAVTTSIRGAYTNQGEVCLCASRQYVQHGIYEKFVEMFRQKVRSDIFVGNPLDPRTFYGPVISQQHMDKVLGYIRLAQEESATVEFLVNPNDIAVKGVATRAATLSRRR
ncbi:Aldehyde/histidinol dehydrogenase [Kickxella alabastrina]|uniref:Aldehyde/histidinol dehydrogenase n=1 Tax=Kickxella alabastrina TaxID=61397 RepID=UPI0022206A5E|nr:Aldehyde/histidinol dehydrogenase [Kickxella alabastrina]KAI7820763.1 Aldehyde/histidinol dehydrogenase [Kickxella alabastrina]